MIRRLPAIALAALIAAPAFSDQCLNKFMRRPESNRQVVTFLTGKLSFQNAQALAAAIHDRKSAPLEWVDDNGKTLAKQFGDLKIVRPMPVGCDGNKSGVIMIATFSTPQVPVKKMNVKFDSATRVTFEEQAQ